MTKDEFDRYCQSLPAVTHVVQWGNSDVWKVGGKVFAISSVRDGLDNFTFKASDMAFEILSDSPGLKPAPYLASRGLKWLCMFDKPGLSDHSLQEHVKASYDMVVASLTKKKRAELGL